MYFRHVNFVLSKSYKIRYDMTKRNEAIAILTGGGPAPGMNTVVGSVAKTFLQKGYSVIGLHKGFTGLFREAPATENITFLKADEIFNLAGSFLRMSRFKPSDEDFEKRFNWQFFTENNIKLLVTIGGDDTASTANRVAKFLEEKRHPIANIHVPKTIDKIIRLMVSSIVKRRIVSMDYGAAVISEGVFHELSEAELSSCGIHFTYDAHGHPELGKVSKACFFSMLLDQRLAELKLNVQTRPVELGYEIRGQTPVAYDLTYCSELGIGVYKLFSEGKTGCMVYVDGCGNVEPLYLKDLQDPATGKILPRMVDISSDRFKAVVDNILMAITPPDYEAARQYLSNPEEYDFCKILGWDETDL